MKPSQLAKSAGLKSLKEMAEKTGYTKDNLIKIFNSDRSRFESLLDDIKPITIICTCATCGRKIES